MADLNFNQLLSTTVNSVLETMFFSIVLGSTEPQANGAVIQSRLNFQGRPSGEFRICLSEPSARLLAAGFLGEDDQTLTDLQTGLVVCEMTNMLCGALLSKLQSEESFDLGTPELAPYPSEFVFDSEVHCVARQSFALQGGILTVSLELERSA